MCVPIPIFVSIRRTALMIYHDFLIFEIGGRPPSWFLNFQNFNGQHVGGGVNMRTAPNFVAIRRSVAEM